MRMLLTGASQGLGDALCRILPRPSDHVFLVSRKEPPSITLSDGVTRQWIEQDLADSDAARRIAAAVQPPLDVLVHIAGIWEGEAFSERYVWPSVSDDEERRIIGVNLLAPMLLTKTLHSQLTGSVNPKVIFIGSTNGLPNSGASEVAYATSKWGLRGLAHSVREYLRPYAIGVTIVNAGTIGDTIFDRQGKTIGRGIPVEDIAAIVRCAIDCSRRTVMKEINVPAMDDSDA